MKENWTPPSPAALKHSGPQRATCAVCGEEIGSYESRQFGETGAVHVWMPNEVAKLARCFTIANQRLFPYFYTDG